MSSNTVRAGRRILFPVAAVTGFASGLLSAPLGRDGWSALDVLMLGTFALLFAWIAFWLWVALLGARRLAMARVARRALSNGSLDTSALDEPRTAIVVPIHNEDVKAVFARIRAMLESIAAAGANAAFEMFVLSDTTDPDVWLREELAWAHLRRIPGLPRLYYRRRLHKFRKKSGNIADFCKRWGARYDYMIVLDADSIMSGDVMSELVRRMDAAPSLGILQAPSLLTMRETLYARLEQFAAATYGPAVFAGIAECFEGAANYWGHNAIVRVKAFAENCGLPGLPGRPPFGGPILSHDFVEAALMRRAGYEVRLAWDLTTGSYEQGPGSLEEARQRDVRWCRGNLQHLRLLFVPTFPAGARVHFAIGAIFYSISAAWAAFILFVAARHVLDGSVTLTSTPLGRYYVPLGLSAAVALILVAGKILAARLAARATAAGRVPRLAASTALEILIASLVAPIRMVSQIRCLVAALGDGSMDWATARRDDRPSSLRRAVRAMFFETAVGALLAATFYRVDPGLALWLSPIWFGLVVSIPIDVMLGSPGVGRWLAERNLLLTPAEADPPEVLRRTAELSAAMSEEHATFAERFRAFIEDSWLNALHVGLLNSTGSRELSSRVIEPLIDRVLSVGVGRLSKREATLVLSDARAMELLHRRRSLAASAA
jgi:membrane glycosyltransferase